MGSLPVLDSVYAQSFRRDRVFRIRVYTKFAQISAEIAYTQSRANFSARYNFFMKARLDFVSNSSSSSFVVLAGENTPDIFKDELLSFDEFYNRFFRRDVVEYLRYGLTFKYVRGASDIFDKITFMTAEEFAEEYTRLDEGILSFSKMYPVLESDRKLVDELRTLSDKYGQFDSPRIEIYRRGKIDQELLRKARNVVYDIQQEYRDKMDGVFDKMTYHFLNAVKDRMSDWKFWYNELDDGQEPAGYGAMNEDGVRWGRVFSNH